MEDGPLRATELPPSPGHGSCGEVRASSLGPAEEVAAPAPGFDPYTIVDNIADLTVEQLKESLLPEAEAAATVKVDVRDQSLSCLKLNLLICVLIVNLECFQAFVNSSGSQSTWSYLDHLGYQNAVHLEKKL